MMTIKYKNFKAKFIHKGSIETLVEGTATRAIVEMKIDEVYSWEIDGTPLDTKFFADCGIKWDACSHWWFRGNDYDREKKEGHDSYYHICGGWSYYNHIMIMMASTELAKQCMEYMRDDTNTDWEEFEIYGKDEILQGVKIEIEWEEE